LSGVRLYCVDGTNLVRTAYGYGGPAHAAQEAEDARRLVLLLAAACEDAGPELEVELFFDGAFRVFPGPRPSNLRVSFTRELTADDAILDRVRARAWGGGGKATVVTADAELGRAVEAEGGKWLRVAHGAPPESVARRIGGRFSR
jgi:hypothetical protein